ncbi:RloB family protein [Klebsiella pneumoniae]|uniref:RloB family protein n=1 Tax=Klebsiella pneumoniae TaxID=573 RepID=UPI0018683EC9|nr:RloB family protein [Klebsiella pneumoniae]EEB8835869.1 RloB domain-containing protein [Salmonella enterica subsp. enterica serovar Kentucky]HCI6195150.1 RloB domain-containing protein [Klebsiella quasipneumoniae subsp. similipneumoniae]HCL9452430.1 RloB domain-containing protein [Klebsiella pneumoniae]
MSTNKEILLNKMYIFCEGAKTEPLYLSSYIEEHARSKSKVIFIPKTKKNTPVQLVDEAVSKKNSKDCVDGDVFWVVYDRESVIKYPRSKHKEAWDKASRNGINIAISNVCFEFWVLLHFDEIYQPYSSFTDLLNNSILKEKLRSVGIKNYDKGSDELYFKIRKGIPNARKRAARVNRSIIASSNAKAEEYDYSPYTKMHELLDAIDSF